MSGKRRWIWLGTALTLCLLVWAVLSGGSRPFARLEEADILSATVCLSPPDVTLELDRKEINELAGLLREAAIHHRDDSWREYAGQGVTVTLELSDGSIRTATAFTPFLIVDGVGYRTEYGPCEALSNFANELLRETS